MELSIVTTLYQSSPHIQEFYHRVSVAAKKICEDYEIILVNDGSPDNSLAEALRLYEQDPRIRLIDLSRNFGQQKALMTGMAHAKGDLVFLIDIDLEEEPELLECFHQELLHTGADVIYGVQTTRKGEWFERLSGRLFFLIFGLLSTESIPTNVVLIRLMTSRYVSALLQHQEREVTLSGLFVRTGYDQKPFQITKLAKSTTSYTFPKKMAHFVSAITAFSNKPLVFVFYLGTLVTLLSVGAGIYLTVQFLFFSVGLPGWPSLIVSICFFGGLIIFCQGLVGLYIAKIFNETKQRPQTIVRHIYERSVRVPQSNVIKGKKF